MFNPSKVTQAAFTAAICIRELFYLHRPFADVPNPTKAEVDNWHRLSLNHIRAMVNYTTPDRWQARLLHLRPSALGAPAAIFCAVGQKVPQRHMYGFY